VKILKQIPVLILGIIYMLSSSGIVVFQSFCACTGNKQVSLYVTPESCETEFHHRHTCTNDLNAKEESTSDDCSQCNEHTGNCGCNSPMVRFFKLDDRVINEKVRIDDVATVDVPLPVFLPDDFQYTKEQNEIPNSFVDPPPRKPTSLDFLIHIHQLKIPYQA
jgi:hypothetical protein